MGIDVDFGRAFAKSQLASNMRLPSSGTAFLSVRDADKAGLAVVAARLISFGFKLIATHGTALYLRERGIDVGMVNKVLEGRPHCVDAMLSGQVQLVVNTTEGPQAMADSFSIRRTALTHGICHYTTLAGARAAVDAIESLRAGPLDVAPLQFYLSGSF
jgi:carbamoyl-phosphate synthase large subunit